MATTGTMANSQHHDERPERAMVSTYAIRSEVIWPTDLSLPARPPRLVYLDMLDWINMAEVF